MSDELCNHYNQYFYCACLNNLVTSLYMMQGSCSHGKPGKVMEFEKKVFPGLEKSWKTRKMPKVMEK